MVIYCMHRMFDLSFETQEEMEDWIKKINIVLSKQVLVLPYATKVKMQNQTLSTASCEVAVTSI